MTVIQDTRKIAIFGASGFVGKELHRFFVANHMVVRDFSRKELLLSSDKLALLLEGYEIIINLVGAPILKKWTPKAKKEISDSRVLSTRRMIQAVMLLNVKPELFISTSAVGIYDSFEVHDEFSIQYANDFLSKVCQLWEREALALIECENTRLCILRLGVVLGLRGGAFPKMVRPFKFGLGGRIGDGYQVFPFIHIKDLMGGIWYLIKREESLGVYNFVAPTMVSNQELTHALAQKLNRPEFFSIPEKWIRWMYGEGAEVLTKGQKVIPSRLQRDGFNFAFPTINSVLDELLS